MDWILDRLACGSLSDAARCTKGDADTIVTLSQELPMLTHGHKSLHAPMDDDKPWPFAKCAELVQYVSRELHDGKRVLVHCHGGVTRSPALCMAYLAGCGFSLDAARQWVEKKRTEAVRMHPTVWGSIVTWWMTRGV